MKNIRKNMKTITIALGIILCLTGCTNQKLNTAYKNMQIEKVESYQLDLRIYGTYQGKNISEIIKIDNYKNNYHIVKPGENDIEKEYYIIDGKSYQKEGDLYKEVKEVGYRNTNAYLEGIKEGKTNKESKEKIGEVEYQVYTFTVPYKKMKDILKTTILKDIELQDKVTGEVYTDKEGRVYKVVYHVESGMKNKEKLTVDASYFRIGTVREITKQDVALQ